MTRLDELIVELCPDGLCYKELKTLSEIGTGSSDRKDSTDDGKYPFYVRSKDILRINKYEYDEEAIVIPGEGGIGEIFHLVNGKYALHQRAYRIHIIDVSLMTKFLYYYMSAHFKEFILQKAVSATVTSIRKPMIEQFPVPVPPLPVQQEIVRILDHFTELTAELQRKLDEELTARKMQYEYYLERLLSDTNVEKKTLSECCESIADGDHQPPPKSDSGIPFITISNINNDRIDFSNTKYVPNSYFEGVHEKRKARFDDILYSVVGSFGIPVHIDFDKPFVFQRHIAILRPNQAVVKSKYLYYCMKSPSFFSQADAVATGAAQRTVGLAMLGRLTVPIVSITEQERIVSILDRFNTICNDLSSGLPAEIAARQKQYEYYRDKLLTFKELKKS